MKKLISLVLFSLVSNAPNAPAQSLSAAQQVAVEWIGCVNKAGQGGRWESPISEARKMVEFAMTRCREHRDAYSRLSGEVVAARMERKIKSDAFKTFRDELRLRWCEDC